MEGHYSTPIVGLNDTRAPNIERSQNTNRIPLWMKFLKLRNSDRDEVLDNSKLRSDACKTIQKELLWDWDRCIYCKKNLVGDAKSGTAHYRDHSNSYIQRKLVDSRQKILKPCIMVGKERGKFRLIPFVKNLLGVN